MSPAARAYTFIICLIFGFGLYMATIITLPILVACAR